jgi:hypothetical protein
MLFYCKELSTYTLNLAQKNFLSNFFFIIFFALKLAKIGHNVYKKIDNKYNHSIIKNIFFWQY